MPCEASSMIRGLQDPQSERLIDALPDGKGFKLVIVPSMQQYSLGLEVENEVLTLHHEGISMAYVSNSKFKILTLHEGAHAASEQAHPVLSKSPQLPLPCHVNGRFMTLIHQDPRSHSWHEEGCKTACYHLLVLPNKRCSRQWASGLHARITANSFTLQNQTKTTTND
jgi:hypothetical protein